MNKQKTLLRLIMLCIVVMISVACLGLGLVACDNSGQQAKPGPTPPPIGSTTVTATFDTDGGTCTSNSAQLINGQSFSLPVPTKTGYTFDGWSANGNKITDKNGNGLNVWNITVNVTIVAIWTANDYTVTFDPSQGELDDTTKDIKYGESFQLPVPTRPGYTFGGWSADGNKITDEEGNGLNVWNITVNVTIVAIWTANDYTVTFDPSEGELDDTTKDIKYGESFQLPVPTRPGYTFGGWSANGNKITDEEGNGLTVWNITVNVTIIAIWTCEHIYEWKITKSATCTTNGSKTGTCEKCNHTETENIDALQHNYVNNVCQNCGEDNDGNIANLTFEYIEATDSYTVKEYTGSAKFLSIPSTYNEKPVTNIGHGAFYDCSTITSITIPANVTSIGNNAFSGCTGLTSITIPDSMTSIETGAFYDCNKLNTVHITDIAKWCGITFEKSSFLNYAFTSTPLYYAHNLYLNGKLVTDLVIPDTVTEIKQFAFYGYSKLTSITIPDGVTSIGERAFYGCSGLTSITIPDEVTSIGESAFDGCRGIKSIAIPKNIKRISYAAFANCMNLKTVNWNAIECTKVGSTIINIWPGCDNLTEVIIGQNVKSIPRNAFLDCEITNLNIPDSVTNIEPGAFWDCSRYLLDITVSSNNPIYHVINNCLIEKTTKTLILGCKNSDVPTDGSVTNIATYAFSNCSGLTSITIPASVTSIGYNAFSGCNDLKEVHITDIAKWCGITFAKSANISTSNPLHYAHNLYLNGELVTDLIIPDTITEIKRLAFDRCTSITSVTIPDSVTSIGSDAFSQCNNLKEVHITNIAKWCGIAFEDSASTPLSYTCRLYLNGELVTDLVIPDTVTEIKNYAFYYCTSITNITIPDSVTSIGIWAFYCCSKLSSVTIPDSVTSIGSGAFSHCNNLKEVHITSIAKWCGIAFEDRGSNPLYYAHRLYLNGELLTDLIIPDTVTEIKNWFAGCTSITSITISDSVTSIGSGAFSGCSGLEEMTIPFVGESRKTASDTYQYPFGYIFGENSSGGRTTTQYYYGSSTSSKTSSTYYIPTSLKRVTVTGGNILYGAFHNCSSLTSITISDSVTSIGSSAFYGCTGLTSITIPDSVTSIGARAFEGCSGLEKITLPFVGATKNGTTDTYFGYIFGASGSSNQSSCVPRNLKEVIITGGTSISNYAFQTCTNITSITIPESVTSIGYNAFQGCSGLIDIYFDGTKAEWDAVEKGSDWNRGTGNYTLHCTDGDYDKNGNKIES